MPHSSPFFSIILPTYNREKLLGDTIMAILGQSFAEFELIIVDDASTDNTMSLVASFDDQRIRYTKNSVNLERSASRNVGLTMSMGKYVCFCDSDDTWASNHLSTLYNHINSSAKNRTLFLSTACQYMTDGLRVSTKNYAGEEMKVNPVSYVFLNEPPTPCVCFNKDLLKDKLFDTNLSINEDVDFYCKLVSNLKDKTSIVFLTDITVSVHIHEDNTRGQNVDFALKELNAKKKILRKYAIDREIGQRSLHGCRHRYVNSFKHNMSNNFLNWGGALFLFLLRYPKDKTNKSKIYDFLHEGLRIL